EEDESDDSDRPERDERPENPPDHVPSHRAVLFLSRAGSGILVLLLAAGGVWRRRCRRHIPPSDVRSYLMNSVFRSPLGFAGWNGWPPMRAAVNSRSLRLS